jgi:hypothetical protein
MRKVFLIIIFITSANFLYAQNDVDLQIARIKYNGGGDWYNDPSAEVNLLKFIAENTNIKTNHEYVVADINTRDILNFPISFLTGHGNIVFNSANLKLLREYFENGGFLFVDDDYGLDKSFRKEIEKVFPNNNLVEIPFDHEIYHSIYDFNNGPPKTHEHDNKSPKGYGLFLGERMVIYYTVESNPSDGWANQDIHNDPEEKRNEALKFGANIIVYALSN